MTAPNHPLPSTAIIENYISIKQTLGKFAGPFFYTGNKEIYNLPQMRESLVDYFVEKVIIYLRKNSMSGRSKTEIYIL